VCGEEEGVELLIRRQIRKKGVKLGREEGEAEGGRGTVPNGVAFYKGFNLRSEGLNFERRGGKGARMECRISGFFPHYKGEEGRFAASWRGEGRMGGGGGKISLRGL